MRLYNLPINMALNYERERTGKNFLRELGTFQKIDKLA